MKEELHIKLVLFIIIAVFAFVYTIDRLRDRIAALEARPYPEWVRAGDLSYGDSNMVTMYPEDVPTMIWHNYKEPAEEKVAEFTSTDTKGDVTWVVPDSNDIDISDYSDYAVDANTTADTGLIDIASFEPPSCMSFGTGDGTEIVIDFSGDETTVTGATSESAKTFFEELLKPFMDEYIEYKRKEKP